MTGFRSKTLRCGCCGYNFKTWEGYVDQDQDRDYGICLLCQADEQNEAHDIYDKLFVVFSNSLNKLNKSAFNGMERYVKEYIVHQAFNDGIIRLKTRGEQ